MKEVFFVNIDDSGRIMFDDGGNEYYYLSASSNLKDVLNNPQLVNVDNQSKEIINKVHELTPRDIQSRIRAGLSAEDISQRFNVSIEKINRYSVQVEREKEIVIEQFQHLPGRQEKKGDKLIDVVNEYFDVNDIDRNGATWLATRIGREPWEIRLYFKHGSSSAKAVWTLDPKRRIISESNELAMEITQYYKDIIEEEVNSSSGTKDIPSDLVNTDEIKNLSGGLRLRKIEQIRNELDNDFSAIARTKPKLSLLHSQNSLSEPQSDQSQLVVAGSNHLVSLDDSPTNDKNNTLAESSDSVSNAIPEASSDAQVKDSNFENAANSDIHDLNITGKLRTKFARNKNKRKSVPSWDEIMLSSNEVSKPNDRGARKSEND